LTLENFTRDYFDLISIWVGLIIAIPVFWTWWSVAMGEARQRKKWLNRAKREKGDDPAVLIVDLLSNTEMRAQVVRYLKSQHIDVAEDRFAVIDRKKDVVPDDMAELSGEIHGAVGKLNYMAADVVHVFFGGPGCVGLMIGAELSNLPCKIHFHQSSRGEGYQDFGPIRYPH